MSTSGGGGGGDGVGSLVNRVTLDWDSTAGVVPAVLDGEYNASAIPSS